MSLLMLIFTNGCYTRIREASKVSPEQWQEKHTKEINHTNDCPSCHKWHYYYHYPYWLNIDGSEKTGLERIAIVGRVFLWTADFTFNILNFWDSSDDDDRDDETRKELPEKRGVQ